MASAEAVAAVVAAGGAHVPELMDELEERLQELARSHGPLLAEHAGATIAAGGKRLRPLLVLLAAGPSPEHPERVLRAMVAVELIHSATLVHDDVLDGAHLRRGRPTVVAAAGRAIATATGDLLFSRAFAELARNGRAGGGAGAVRRVVGAGRGRAPAARGRVERRRLARALRAPLRPQDRAALPGGVRAGRARGRRAGRRARALRAPHRPRLPAARRRARRLRAGRAHRQAPRHRPARRHGHAPAHPRARARPGAALARPPRACARRRRPRRCATRSSPPACWTKHGMRRSASWPTPRRTSRRCRRPSRERWSWWPTGSSTDKLAVPVRLAWKVAVQGDGGRSVGTLEDASA